MKIGGQRLGRLLRRLGIRDSESGHLSFVVGNLIDLGLGFGLVTSPRIVLASEHLNPLR
jgi:hypothetical protein